MRNVVKDKTITTYKVGAEDILMIRVPAVRFHSNISQHHTPIMYSKSQYQVAILAQACESNSFENVEAGRTYDFQLWLQVGSSKVSTRVKGAEIMLPDMYWLSLKSATSNTLAKDYLRLFGFKPLSLSKTKLNNHGGSLVFADEGSIEWTITGSGKELPAVGVNHVVYMQEDGPSAVGHHISALLSNAVMELPGNVHIQTTALEPFLKEDERMYVIIHRMNKLEADVVWQQHSN